jgi:hypothetical protein
VFIVDGDKLEDTILGDDRNDHLLVGLTIDIDEWDSPSAGLEHASTGLIKRL